MECDKKEDPLIFGDEMMGEKLGHTEIKKAQQADEFAQMMVERCSRADASKDECASKFRVIDGALYRVTGSSDPQEGRESQRIYVPLELRKALMRNYHSAVCWTKHQHSRSMHKQMVAWYYRAGPTATNSRQRNAVAHLHSERDKRTYAGHNASSLFTKIEAKEAPRKISR